MLILRPSRHLCTSSHHARYFQSSNHCWGPYYGPIHITVCSSPLLNEISPTMEAGPQTTPTMMKIEPLRLYQLWSITTSNHGRLPMIKYIRRTFETSMTLNYSSYRVLEVQNSPIAWCKIMHFLYCLPYLSSSGQGTIVI